MLCFSNTNKLRLPLTPIAKLEAVYIVVHDLPYGFQHIVEVFSEFEEAKKFIEDEHPYLEYFDKFKLWTYPDVDDESVNDTESFKIEERSVRY